MLLQCQKFGPDDSTRPDVVLIHGTGADATLWQPQVEMLVASGYRCYVPDLRGHGQTEEPCEPTDLDVHIKDLLQTMEAQGVRSPAIFVGHSLGAVISVLLAEQKPELFKHILAVSMPGKVFKLVSRIFGAIVSYPYEPLRGTVIHRSLSRRHQMVFSTHRHSLQQIVHNFRHINFIDAPLKVQCRVHFSVGRLDFVAPYFYVQRLHRALPNSTLRIFEWAGHCCMDDQPEQFNDWFMEKMLDGEPAKVPG